jgi:hypothetical protein
MIAAESLTGSPTSLFWLTVVLIVIAVISGAIGLFAWRSGFAKKRLLLSIISRTRLLSAPEPIRDDLSISYGKFPLKDPYVIALEIENIGKSVIRSEEFDQARNLGFSFNASIVKILSVEHRPTSAPLPTIIANDDKLELEPELIIRGETIEAAILIDGPLGDIETVLNPLGDVDIQIRDREAWLAQRSRRRVLTALTGATAVTALVTVATILTTIQINKSLTLGKQAVSISSCSSLIQTIEGTGLALTIATGDIVLSDVKPTNTKLISFAKNYRQDVSDVKIQAKDMAEYYNAVKESGISLGATASIPGKTIEAISILQRLPDEGTTAKALNDLDTILSISSFLESSRAIPQGCS